MSEVFFVQMVGINVGKCEGGSEKKLRWLNPRCGIQVGRIQDGCHHQVRWEWMSLSQIELVWVKVRLEWECFWVNLRDDNKVSESKMVHGRIQDGCHHQVESEWMSLSQIELVWVRVLCKMGESKMAEFRMAAIIKLGENEWVWVRLN